MNDDGHDDIATELGEAQRQEALQRSTEVERWRGYWVEAEWLDWLQSYMYHSEIKGSEIQEFIHHLVKYPPWLAFDNPPESYFWYSDHICEVWKEFRRYMDRRDRDKHQEAARKVWAFSLTTPDRDAAPDLWEATVKLFEQRSVPVVVGEAHLEYGASGLPHVHGWYETGHGGRIFTKVFKRCWPLWGEDKRHHTAFRGGFHEKAKNPAAYKLYAAAEERLIVRREKSNAILYGPKPSSSRPSCSASSQASGETEETNPTLP